MTRVFAAGDVRIRIKSRSKGVVWKIMRWVADDMSGPVEDRERTLPPKASVVAIEKEIADAYEERGETLKQRWLAEKKDQAGRDPRLAMMWETSGSVYAAYVDRDAA